MTEAGVEPVSITPRGGLFGPAKMPKEVVDRLAREMAVVLARSEVRDAFGKLAFEPRSSIPQPSRLSSPSSSKPTGASRARSGSASTEAFHPSTALASGPWSARGSDLARHPFHLAPFAG